MAIRFSHEINEELRSSARNYNKRVKRATERGFRNLPPLVKVSEIKARSKTLSDLKREINFLNKFNRSQLAKTPLNQSVNAAKWQIDFIKSNLSSAQEYFENEYKRVSKRVLRFPGERTYIDTIKSKINLLNQNTKDLTQSQFRSTLSAVTEYFNAPANRTTQYRGFLSEVEWVMEKLDIPEEERDAFFNKFSTLTPSQFLYAYDNNDIIDRVYNIYTRQGEDEPYIADKKDAKIYINRLLKEADEIVEDAKLNMD